ncbi:MAG: hypothetical protein ACLFVU_09450 [Phycisphaerae bacterium]
MRALQGLSQEFAVRTFDLVVGGIFLLGNIWLVVIWLDEKGVIDWAGAIRKEYLTGTAITIIIALLVLLVGPRGLKARLRRCPVCDHVLLVRGKYCSDCGRKVAS